MIRRMKWLPEAACSHIGSFYDNSEFIDGKNSGTANRDIKRNQEMKGAGEAACIKLFCDQWWKSGFAKQILTKKITTPMFVKYTAEEKGHYAFHNDVPMMGTKDNCVRSDYVMITGINDASEYDGGGLQVRMGSETYEYRIGKGECIFFDPNQWHAVTPVTKGVRKVSIMWIETLIQDDYVRELIYEYQDLMDYALESIDANHWTADIEPATYFNAIKYKLMRKYANNF